ncbi:unnamed protein product [Hyaloperonospora brassicae]|uniref:Uncharacterized protein n=1 Tax=Hyaloperonospora brassicae TaxID=162125 RepID=A0AAV0UYR7_HYABA|nr:unnamed protein product [Hyaloperonospora brassicae]
MSKKKVVLEEEQYVEKLGQIIERDFFPDLSVLKRRTELFQNDEKSVVRVDTIPRGTRLGDRTSERSDASGVGWDHAPEPLVDHDLKQKDEIDAGDSTTASMTLDRFVATYTSEDNESFNELQDKALRDHKRRYHWAYDDDEERGDPKLHLLTDGTWITKEKRRIVDESCAPKGPKDTRPSAPETWKFRARNLLLFPPDSPSSRDVRRVPAGSEDRQLLNYDPRSHTRQPPKARKKTVYANSRFPRENARDYSLIPMTPLIAPGVHGSPLMTWGEIEGTPAELGAVSVRNMHTPSFELQETSRREKLANRLESEARHRNLDSRTLGLKTPLRKRPEVDRRIRCAIEGKLFYTFTTPASFFEATEMIRWEVLMRSSTSVVTHQMLTRL